MRRDNWDVFHDGTIASIRGNVPGDVIIHIDIGYLREMFEGAGSGFDVHLSGCAKLEYLAYDEDPTSDFATIGSKEPELLDVSETEPDIVLICTGGLLVLNYAEVRVFAEAGEFISDEALKNAANNYWDSR